MEKVRGKSTHTQIQKCDQPASTQKHVFLSLFSDTHLRNAHVLQAKHQVLESVEARALVWAFPVSLVAELRHRNRAEEGVGQKRDVRRELLRRETQQPFLDFRCRGRSQLQQLRQASRSTSSSSTTSTTSTSSTSCCLCSDPSCTSRRGGCQSSGGELQHGAVSAVASGR